ncbi:MAG: TM2 domain-containing protein [Betaproteobacteria bacterium]|nr:TM2 domain-containing protein [Betaproteobacteria bacterium]
MKNKTIAAWLAFLGGPIGLHRFYLFGWDDTLGWLLPIPTALGMYGVSRAQDFGVDDVTSWWLVLPLGFNVAACALNAIVYALMDCQKWNQRFNPDEDALCTAGNTNWLTIGAMVLSLLVGSTALLSSLAYGFQRYFEYQLEEAQKISQ